MPAQERLFLLDGMALAYRAYFAFINRPLITSKGENTSAVYGFVQSLLKIMDDEKPEHVAVVFDTKQPTFRHKEYPQYKATREKMPEDMYASMDRLKEVIRAFNIPIVEVPGYEADDIIGTLARRAERENVMTYMVTPDKDFMQLVTPKIKIYKPGRASSDVEIIDESGVAKKFGVTPERVIDVLGLIGDTSDNIPGVKGIGEKTAIPLIQKYGSMENLYEHVSDIPQKGVREKLTANKEAALLSKRLVTIDTAVPLSIDFHSLRSERRNTSELIRLFGELEFRGLAGKLRDTEPFNDVPPPSVPAPSAALVLTKEYHTVLTHGALQDLCTTLKSASTFALCAETDAQHPLKGRIAMLSFSAGAGKAYVVPVAAEGGEGDLFGSTPGEHRSPGGGLPLHDVLHPLKPILEDPRIEKIGYNIKTSMMVLRRGGIELAGSLFDPMVASYVLRADSQHTLESLANEYFGHSPTPPGDLPGKGKQQKHDLSLQEQSAYRGEQIDIAFQTCLLQKKQLAENSLDELSSTIEFPLIRALSRMEFSGITLDVAYLREMSKNLESMIAQLVRDIHREAGKEFNINSTQQLGDVLFNSLQLPTLRKTKTGFSTDVTVLETLRGRHPIIDSILEYRQLSKLKSTYVDALPSLIAPDTGKLHTSFNQTVAATGRLSSSDPNLQNIPIRTDLGRAIRQAFVPGSAGSVILSADYSQIELRVMAHICGDDGLQEAFRANEDIHSSTAAKVFGVSPGDITRDMRRKAKEVNFGIMYGIGPFGLATRLEITQSEAREIIERYFVRFPKVKQFINDTIESAKRSGYVETLLGRRRYIPDINSRNRNIRGNAERQAINMPIQGTAADMIKIAMIRLDDEIARQSLQSRMILQVHDELVFEVPEKELPSMRSLVAEKMRHAIDLTVPVEVEVGSGRNWLEAH